MEKRQHQLLDDPLKRKLEDILSDDSYPSPSLREVAKDLGYPKEQLYNRFPSLCRAIVKRHNQLFDENALRGMLEAALLDDTTPPPSLRELAKRFGFGEKRIRRHVPDLCTEIMQRYQEYRKNLRITRLQQIHDDVKDAILCLYAEEYYPSLPRVRTVLQDKKYWIKDVNDAWREIMRELPLDNHGKPNL